MTTQTIAQINAEVSTIKGELSYIESIEPAKMFGRELAEFLGVKRVSDRATGIKRVEKAISEQAAEYLAKLEALQAALTEAQKAEAPKEEVKARRSTAEGVAKSWTNPEVRARRLTRQSVVVNGEEFNSTPAAFNALGLPMKKMIKFRLELKAAGFATFTHNGEEYKFVIAD